MRRSENSRERRKRKVGQQKEKEKTLKRKTKILAKRKKMEKEDENRRERKRRKQRRHEICEGKHFLSGCFFRRIATAFKTTQLAVTEYVNIQTVRKEQHFANKKEQS